MTLEQAPPSQENTLFRLSKLARKSCQSGTYHTSVSTGRERKS